MLGQLEKTEYSGHGLNCSPTSSTKSRPHITTPFSHNRCNLKNGSQTCVRQVARSAPLLHASASTAGVPDLDASTNHPDCEHPLPQLSSTIATSSLPISPDPSDNLLSPPENTSLVSPCGKDSVDLHAFEQVYVTGCYQHKAPAALNKSDWTALRDDGQGFDCLATKRRFATDAWPSLCELVSRSQSRHCCGERVNTAVSTSRTLIGLGTWDTNEHLQGGRPESSINTKRMPLCNVSHDTVLPAHCERQDVHSTEGRSAWNVQPHVQPVVGQVAESTCRDIEKGHGQEVEKDSKHSEMQVRSCSRRSESFQGVPTHQRPYKQSQPSTPSTSRYRSRMASDGQDETCCLPGRSSPGTTLQCKGTECARHGQPRSQHIKEYLPTSTDWDTTTRSAGPTQTHSQQSKHASPVQAPLQPKNLLQITTTPSTGEECVVPMQAKIRSQPSKKPLLKTPANIRTGCAGSASVLSPPSNQHGDTPSFGTAADSAGHVTDRGKPCKQLQITSVPATKAGFAAPVQGCSRPSKQSLTSATISTGAELAEAVQTAEQPSKQMYVPADLSTRVASSQRAHSGRQVQILSHLSEQHSGQIPSRTGSGYARPLQAHSQAAKPSQITSPSSICLGSLGHASQHNRSRKHCNDTPDPCKRLALGESPVATAIEPSSEGRLLAKTQCMQATMEQQLRSVSDTLFSISTRQLQGHAYLRCLPLVCKYFQTHSTYTVALLPTGSVVNARWKD
jgi:hypothetical protein